jgi:uncharacterized protein (TIGR03000 family)
MRHAGQGYLIWGQKAAPVNNSTFTITDPGRSPMKPILLPLLVAVALLVLPTAAQAQRGGHGGGRGGGGAHVSHGTVHHGTGHNGVIVVRSYYGGYGLGYYGAYAPYYGGYNGYGGYGTYAPVYYSPTIVVPDYGMQTAPTTASLPNDRAQVQVVLPNPEATLLFDGNKTSSVGRVRLFEPPQLEPGVYYTYKVSISWLQSGQVMTDVRNVSIIGGRVSVVDFTRPADAEPLNPPAILKKE